MKAIKRRTITLIIGIIVALSAVAIGSSLAESHKIAKLPVENEIPTINLIDLNKVFYVLFSKQ